MANEVTIHVKADGHPDRDVDRMAKRTETTAKRSFLKSGGHAGAAFMAGFIKTITLGQVGSGFAMAATKLKPQMAHIGGSLGVAIAAGVAVKMATALSALLPLALGGAILAGPIAFAIIKQVKAAKELDKVNTKIASLEDRIAKSKGKTREEMEKQLRVLQTQRIELANQVAELDRLKRKASDFMNTISKPVRVPLAESMKMIGDRLDDWGPKLRKAMKPLAKELPGFVKGLLGGIENFAAEIGKKMPSITKGFKEWGKQLPGIGKALGKMLAAWIEDGPAVAEGVQETAESFNDLAKAVGKVGKAFKGFNKANDSFVEFREQVRATALTIRAVVLDAMADAAEGMEKLGLLPKRVAKNFRRLADEAEKELGKVNREIAKSAEKTAKTKWEAKIRADKKDLEKKYKESKQRLEWLKKQKPTPKVKADIKAAQEAFRKVKYEMQRINAMIARPKIKPTYSGINAKNAGAPFHAAGGNVGSQGAASGGNRGGAQVWVGEQGPELVDLPFGSHVNSNPDSMAKAGKGTKSGGDTHFHFHGPVYGDHNALRRALVDMKRSGQLDVVMS